MISNKVDFNQMHWKTFFVRLAFPSVVAQAALLMILEMDNLVTRTHSFFKRVNNIPILIAVSDSCLKLLIHDPCVSSAIASWV